MIAKTEIQQIFANTKTVKMLTILMRLTPHQHIFKFYDANSLATIFLKCKKIILQTTQTSKGSSSEIK
jgi:hypothetical protein